MLDLWKDRPPAILSFTEIKEELGWTSDKTTRQLATAIDEGYLARAGHGGKQGYRNMMSNYSGYFDGFEYLAEIDKHCRKSGKVQSVDHPLRMFTPLHVVEYGVPKEEDLTPLESELLFTIRARLAHAFEDYSNLCEDIEWRQKLEGFKKLPDSVRNPLFARDDRKDKGMPPTSVTGAQMIYGDVLWEHIFENIMDGVRRMLVQGTLDATGPVQLLYAYKPVMDTASKIADKIREGKANYYNDPDPATTGRLFKQMQERDSNRVISLGGREPPDIAVVVTHSPRTMGKYSYQIGTIVGDKLAYWSDNQPTFATVLQKGKTKWDDTIKDVTGVRSRRDALAYGMVTDVANMRWRFKEPISESDKKFMLKDTKLREVLTEEQVLRAVAEVTQVIGRARKFAVLIEDKAPPSKLLKNPEWFTDDEFTRFSFLDHAIAPAYHFPKGTSPKDVKLPRYEDIFEELEQGFSGWKLGGTKGKVVRARKPGGQ